MTATTSEKKICVPGERLFADNEEHRSGKGTHSTHGFIYSSVAGFLHVIPPRTGEEKASTVEVRRFEDDDHAVPFLGAIVTAKVSSFLPIMLNYDLRCRHFKHILTVFLNIKPLNVVLLEGMNDGKFVPNSRCSETLN